MQSSLDSVIKALASCKARLALLPCKRHDQIRPPSTIKKYLALGFALQGHQLPYWSSSPSLVDYQSFYFNPNHNLNVTEQEHCKNFLIIDCLGKFTFGLMLVDNPVVGCSIMPTMQRPLGLIHRHKQSIITTSHQHIKFHLNNLGYSPCLWELLPGNTYCAYDGRCVR